MLAFDELWEQKVPPASWRDQSEQYPLTSFKFIDNSNDVWIDGTLFL